MSLKLRFLCVLLTSVFSKTAALTADADNQELNEGSPETHPFERNACPPALQDRCTCGYTFVPEGPQGVLKRRYVTNCTDAGFSDATVLQSLPVETEILLFTGNNLTSLPNYLLGNDPTHQHEKLRTIDLSSNNIYFIHANTFLNVRNVTKLVLDNNSLIITSYLYSLRWLSNFENLEQLSLRNTFDATQMGMSFTEGLVTMLEEANLTKLKSLRLDNNSIHVLPSVDAFCPLKSLRYLYLSSNYLVEADINVSCLPKLRLLDISDNFITSLNSQVMATYDKPKGITFILNVTANPFQCDCELLPFLRWIRRTSTWVIRVRELRCATGYPRNVGKAIWYLNESDLQCPGANAGKTSGVMASHYVLVTVITVSMAVMIIGALIVWAVRGRRCATRSPPIQNKKLQNVALHLVHWRRKPVCNQREFTDNVVVSSTPEMN